MTFCNLAHNSLSMKLSEGDKVLCNLQLLWDFSISFPSTDFGLFAAGLEGWVGGKTIGFVLTGWKGGVD